MRKLFTKKEIFKVKSLPVDPSSMGEPSTVDDLQKRGMAYYARKQFKEAEADLKKAISMDGNNIDSYYSLGMVLKAMNRKEDAVAAFKQALNLINAIPDSKTTKYDMLRRMALGHVNEMTQGDWNLEKEIWKHIG
jgi:tetratricopeptide (TPR) repeat protein